MTDFLLYAATVALWGSSWIAVKLHLGVVAPEVSLAYRVGISAAIMLAFCLATGRRLSFAPRQHAWLVLQGGLLFGGNYLLIYHGTLYLTSGLVAVVFSAVVVFNIVFGALFFGLPIRPRVALGAAVGLAGIGFVFWHDIVAFDIARDGSKGLLFALAGSMLASLGMLVSGRNQMAGIRVIEGNALGMTYGTLLVGAWVLATGIPVTVDPRPVYWGALAFLSLASTVVGFWTYLTLLGRIGADRAGYTTVMFPIVAIALSVAFEGYRPTGLALVGMGLVLAGNILILMRRTAKPVATTAATETQGS